MKAHQIHSYLLSLGRGWVDPQNTVDGFKAGDPETELIAIAVSWMSSIWALREALQLDCNLFITHEPTYFSHEDNDPRFLNIPEVIAKQEWIAATGMVILRCHDVWDQYPGEGIPDSWARWLQLGPAIAGEGYYRIYDVSGRTALEVARQVARQTVSLGQEAVQLIGPADKAVTRLAIGTGAVTPLLHFIQAYHPDLALCTDDGISYWRDAALAIDLDMPLIVVNHTVSEEPGMISLAEHLRRAFHPLSVHHIPQGCPYSLIRTE